MNVSLTPELEKLLKDEIKGGQYKSANEVVREGLRLVGLRREKLAALRKELAIGLDQLDRAEYVEYASVEELFDDIQAEVTKQAKNALNEATHPLTAV